MPRAASDPSWARTVSARSVRLLRPAMRMARVPEDHVENRRTGLDAQDQSTWPDGACVVVQCFVATRDGGPNVVVIAGLGAGTSDGYPVS